MGSANFTIFEAGDIATAFFKAQAKCDQRGYSGTIAEKDGFQIRSPKPMTMDEAHEVADKDIENNDKWGPAFAIEVIDVDQHGKKVRGYLFYGYASC